MLTRRAFLGGLLIGSTIIGGVAVAHHRPGHQGGPKPRPSPSPSPVYSDIYSDVY